MTNPGNLENERYRSIKLSGANLKKERVPSSGKNEENIAASNRITRQLFCSFRTESEQGSIFSIAERKPRKRSFLPHICL
jgi:hypothetical protein